MREPAEQTSRTTIAEAAYPTPPPHLYPTPRPFVQPTTTSPSKTQQGIPSFHPNSAIMPSKVQAVYSWPAHVQSKRHQRADDGPARQVAHSGRNKEHTRLQRRRRLHHDTADDVSLAMRAQSEWHYPRNVTRSTYAIYSTTSGVKYSQKLRVWHLGGEEP
jgi:hypothetical protein